MTSWTVIIAICTTYVTAGVIHGAPASEDHTTDTISIKDQCFTWECLISVSWIDHSMNSSVDPCDDFYAFTCGRFGKYPPRLHQYNEDIYEAANKEIAIRLKHIIENIDKTNSSKPFKLVKILYDNCMNSGNLEQAEASKDEIYEFYQKMAGILGWPVVVGPTWRSLAMSNKLILFALLDVEFQFSTLDTSYSIPQIKLGHHVLDTAILRMGFNNEIVQAYYKYMVDMAVILGADRVQAESELKEVVDFEIMLANDTVSEADRWIHYSDYNLTTVIELVAEYPDLHIRKFLWMHIPEGLYDDNAILVPKDFANIGKAISRTPKRVLANLIQWNIIDASVSKLGGELRDRHDEFHNLITRSTQPAKKWQQCVETVKSYLGLSLSALYQRKYIDRKIIDDVHEMATLIEDMVYNIVDEADWLDRASKTEALEKINNMIGHLSYRDEYENNEKLEEFYKDLELVEGDLQQSIAKIDDFLVNYEHRQLQHASNRDDWIQHGNLFSDRASYKHDLNIYKVPAIYVSTDIYDAYRAKFLNYGTLGYVIAHEMAHSIDNDGTFYDSNANRRAWLSSESAKRFKERVQCMIEQYGNYTVDEIGLNLQAHRNLAENIADNLATKAAYRAYLKWSSINKAEQLLPGLPYTSKQLFWIGMGNYRCTSYQNLELMSTVLTDVHSPAKYRINGALANRPEFATDFGCKPGSRMNPVNKCSVW